MVVHKVTFYHPPHSGSKETAQLSSSRLQRHSMTEAWSAYLWRPQAVQRHEEKHCVRAQMIGTRSVPRKVSQQTLSHRKYEVHCLNPSTVATNIDNSMPGSWRNHTVCSFPQRSHYLTGATEFSQEEICLYMHLLKNIYVIGSSIRFGEWFFLDTFLEFHV